ncbi:anti-sigma factor family protein [Streptomyces aureocirculatus]|uniref:anti-sigma factor family protein n=1 Tax=Streptomyces aureocirculatus TaxID=67275 RepID=UPI0007C7BD7A|nr:zf-HC2 domain-containing protein [Streptomyces aureocirculatus]
MSTPYDAQGHGQDRWGPGPGSGDVHETVGSYALGILDDTEATEFEAHLAGCDFCARQLEELSGMEPMLAALADFPDAGLPGPSNAAGGHRRGAPRIGEQLAARPDPGLADRLVDEVAAKRSQRRRRGMYLVAAAAALIIGGPLAVVAATGDDDGSDRRDISGSDPHPTSPAEDAFFHHMVTKKAATDPTTKVTATVGTEKKAWGTHTVLELKNVKGPLKCSLIAVGKDGKKETVTTWSVPQWGYGIQGSPHQGAQKPLYVHGGAAFDRNDIDHFEVRTFEGERLVEVDV